MSLSTSDGRRSSTRARRRHFRPDIEGLRAIAVLAVVLYHAGLPLVPGGFVGVDVFFVISGFLITGLLHAEVDRTQRLAFARFYARRIKRLLPAAGVVLVLTAIASYAVLPPLERAGVGGDVLAAASYVVNLRFAFQQTNYLSPGGLPSPIQHYWSLSVEEQFYIVWPILIGLVAALARYGRIRLRPPMMIALLWLGSLSLVLSLHQTANDQPFAFFGSPARVWELSLGGMVALAAPVLARVVPAVLRVAAGWVGLVLILDTCLRLHASTPFPGTAALPPTIGTALVLLSGIGRSDTDLVSDPQTPPPTRRGWSAGPVAVLGTRPMRLFGRISYSLYLWHWPPLILVGASLGYTLKAWQGLLISVLVIGPAYLSWRYLEEPFRRSRVLVEMPRRAFVLAGACLSLALLAALLPLSATWTEQVVHVRVAGDRIVRINPVAVRDDLPAPYQANCNFSYGMKRAQPCFFGPAHAPVTVALFGDSHAVQWYPAIDAIAHQHGWRVEVLMKYSCTVADVPIWNYELDRPYPECSAWRTDAMRLLTAKDGPRIVFLASRDSNAVMQGGHALSSQASIPLLTDGLARTLRTLRAAGKEVVLIRDTPEDNTDVPTCLSAHPTKESACAFNVARVPPFTHYEDRAVAEVRGVYEVDGLRLVCATQLCPVVSKSGVVKYRDGHHLTAAYVRAVAPRFERMLRQAGLPGLTRS